MAANLASEQPGENQVSQCGEVDWRSVGLANQFERSDG